MKNIITEISFYSGAFISFAISIFIIIFVVSLIRVVFYEKKINKLHKKLEDKKDDARSRRASMETIEAVIKKLENEEYGPKIKQLERRRRFILEKLPSVKK